MQNAIAAHECVSDEALAHLKDYKYSSVDQSLISRYILKHYWNAFVELLPLWLAPNMVTLLGFFFILGNVALLEIFMPDLKGPGPSWLYFSFAIGLWMYSTMDNVDGKQARRTGTSSGLGELFDHGIDSLNCTLASLLETAAMGYGATKTGAFTVLIPTLPMFFSTWETYHTHTLYLGYFNGPTEGLIIACSLMLLSGTFGPEIWSTPLLPLLPDFARESSVMAMFPEDLTLRELWVPLLLSAFFVAHLPACIMNVRRARQAQGKPFYPLILEWTPMVVFTYSCIAWLGSPHTHIVSSRTGEASSPLQKFNLLHSFGIGRDNASVASDTGGHLVLFALTMSCVFGRMTTKTILAHLTKQPFPYWTATLAPLVGGAILANSPTLFPDRVKELPEWVELVYLRAYFAFAAIVYANWAVLVISRITAFLDIWCLSIKPESEKRAAKGGRVTRSAASAANGEASKKKN